MLDHGRGDHVADVLGLPQALEGDADDLAALDDGPAAVARIDGGVGLNGEMLVGPAVNVRVGLDARDHALGHGDAVAASGKSVGRDGGIDFRNARQLQRDHAFEEAAVIDGQHGQVAIVADKNDPGRIALRQVLLAQLDVSTIADVVRVRENRVAGDHKPGAHRSPHPLSLPRSDVVERLLGAVDEHNRFLRMCQSGRLRRSWGQQQGQHQACNRRNKMHPNHVKHSTRWDHSDSTSAF